MSDLKPMGGDNIPWPWLRRGDDDAIPWNKIFGDGDPIPWAKKDAVPPGRWEPGIADYFAVQVGPFVDVTAQGMVSYSNTEVKLFRSAITVFPPEYVLLFQLPQIGLPMQKPFTVTASFMATERVSKVVVWDKKGEHDVEVVQAPW
ncbi:hypothetical protein [Bradyrhizobium symbiodeficiens]|uniref:hypothetical protein n=1 Tax=Bradyrhizobium symbiodeficiens TaxID=1404367 RepID=UPI00140F737B|nr:hypothetical protein [Bradyrhizobium symbiodeficiens]QIO98355.1 hypothetical protein HAU86_00335 [Bradyrhizobium symbiodeficiens]